MNVWFLGDLHAGHKNIHKYRTQFESEEHHFQVVKENYFKVVRKKDKVFFLGDTAFTKERLLDVAKWPGTKVALLGNHDLESELTVGDYVNAFDDVQGFVKYKDYWLSHCPIHPNELRGKLNLHGHVHNKTVEDARYFNCSLENIDYTPISLNQVREILKERNELPQ